MYKRQGEDHAPVVLYDVLLRHRIALLGVEQVYPVVDVGGCRAVYRLGEPPQPVVFIGLAHSDGNIGVAVGRDPNSKATSYGVGLPPIHAGGRELGHFIYRMSCYVAR